MDSMVPATFRVYFATFGGCLLYLSSGSVIGWPSPIVAKFAGIYSDEELSWVASISGLGAALGPALVGATLDNLGRKPTVLLDLALFLISWTVLLSSSALYAIFVARFIAGIALGASFCIMSAYISEIANDKVRGSMGAVNETFTTLGLLIQYCVGPFVSYRVLSAVSLCVGLLFGLVFIWMPESPYHLINKGRHSEARRALNWLRGNPPEHIIDDEMNAIQRTLSEESNRNTRRSDIIRKKGPAKALFICIFIMICMELSGLDIVVNYTQPIFEMAHMSVSAEMSPIYVGLVSVFSAALASPLVFRFGMKNILILSGTGMAICMILLGVYFSLLSTGRDISSYSFLPVVILMVYNFFFAIGIGPLPWAITAEMLPLHLKDVGSFIVGTFTWLLTFAFVKSYENFKTLFGAHVVFLFLGIATVLGMLVVWFILPDTRGMSLNDI